jgi:hypothetical protein
MIMANQNDLPIWARILLGIPVSDVETNDSGHADRQGSERERVKISREFYTNNHTGLMFIPSADNRTSPWATMLRPARWEF